MLSLSNYLIREHVSFLRLTDTYDVIDPTSGTRIGEAREDVSVVIKLLRLLVSKTLLPTKVVVTESTGAPVFSISRGLHFLRAKVEVHDGTGRMIGYFKNKLFSLGGGFFVFDAQEHQIAEIKGDWKGWTFRFISAETEVGTVTKKWAGIGRELFTSADNYMISIDGADVRPDSKILLLAAGLAIDIVYKEK